MSIRATNFVRRLRGLDPSEKAVAFVLADHEDHKTGETYPGMETVAEEAGFAFRQNASDTVQKLAKYRVILTDKPSKGGKPTVWRFNYTLSAVPEKITLASVRNRSPRAAVHRSPRAAVNGTGTATGKKATAAQNEATAVQGLQEGFESNSKGESKSKEEAEEALRARVTAAAAEIDQAFDLFNRHNHPFGSFAFQLQWLETVRSSPHLEGDLLHTNGTLLHNLMIHAIERCIQSCRLKRIPVPPPLFFEKRFAEHYST